MRKHVVKIIIGLGIVAALAGSACYQVWRVRARYNAELSSLGLLDIEHAVRTSAVSTPPGWKSGGIDDRHSVIFQGPSGMIYVCIYRTPEVKVGTADSRRPRYFAQRYARAWGKACTEWAGASSTQVFETRDVGKSHTVTMLSAVSARGEAEIMAEIKNQVDTAVIRTTLYHLLSAAHDTRNGQLLFPNMPQFPVKVQPYTNDFLRNKFYTERYGRYSIRVPNNWYPDELVFPNPINSGLDMPELGVEFTLIPNSQHYGGSISIYWVDKRDAKQFSRKSHFFKQAAASGTLHGFQKTILSLHGKHQGLVFSDPVLPAGNSNQSIENYFYFSDSLATKARGISMHARWRQLHDRAVASIFNQLIAQSPPGPTPAIGVSTKNLPLARQNQVSTGHK